MLGIPSHGLSSARIAVSGPGSRRITGRLRGIRDAPAGTVWNPKLIMKPLGTGSVGITATSRIGDGTALCFS